jgi:hypothetical protein
MDGSAGPRITTQLALPICVCLPCFVTSNEHTTHTHIEVHFVCSPSKTQTPIYKRLNVARQGAVYKIKQYSCCVLKLGVPNCAVRYYILYDVYSFCICILYSRSSIQYQYTPTGIENVYIVNAMAS